MAARNHITGRLKLKRSESTRQIYKEVCITPSQQKLGRGSRDRVGVPLIPQQRKRPPRPANGREKFKNKEGVTP